MFPRCFHMFPYVSMAEKRIEGIGRGQLIERASRFFGLRPQKRSGAELYASSAAHAYSANPNKVRVRPPSLGCRPSFSIAFRGPRRRVENDCEAHFDSSRL